MTARRYLMMRREDGGSDVIGVPTGAIGGQMTAVWSVDPKTCVARYAVVYNISRAEALKVLGEEGLRALEDVAADVVKARKAN